MKTWLVVLGDSRPGYADSRRRMRTFEEGVHDVTDDEETIAWARRAQLPLVLLYEGVDPPQAVGDVRRGPLCSADFRFPRDGKLVLVQPDVVQEIAEAQDDDRPLTFPCPYCEARFPHPAPLRRHVLRAHGASAEPANDQAAEEPPHDPEPALTDA